MKTIMARIGMFAIVVVFANSDALAACPSMSIPELVAARSPQPVDREITRELTPMALREIVGGAEIIIEATVHRIKTYLSPDECYLLTDYAVTPRAMIAGTIPAASKPGPQPLVITQFGGDTVIDGVKATVRDRQLPPLPSTEPLILFLVRSSQDKSKYELVGTVNGAFRVDVGGRVRSLMKAPPDYAESIPVERDVFIQKVKSFRSKNPG